MIVIVSKIRLRRGNDVDLPGTPIEIDPPRFNAGLDTGEFGYTMDSARLFIGHNPTSGNANYNRTVFPYQNLEILTENSPRVRELFNQNVRDQNDKAFFYKTSVPANSSWVPVPYADYEGGASLPTRFYGDTISATVEYHAFVNSDPIKQGTLRILGRDQVVTTSLEMDADFVEMAPSTGPAVVGSIIEFRISTRITDGTGTYYELQCRNNHTAAPVTLVIRKILLADITNDAP